MDQQNTTTTASVDATGGEESAADVGTSEETVSEHRTSDYDCHDGESVERNDRSSVDESQCERASACAEGSKETTVIDETGDKTQEYKNEDSIDSCAAKETMEKCEPHCSVENLVKEGENIGGDAVETIDAASVANDCNEPETTVEDANSEATRVDRNCDLEEDRKNLDETPSDPDESDATHCSSGDKVDVASNAQSSVDLPVVTVVAAIADESLHEVETKATIEQTTECIEFSLIEYPGESTAESASSSTETIELILQSSDEADGEVFKSEAEAIDETVDKPALHCAASSTTICDTVTFSPDDDKDFIDVMENSNEADGRSDSKEAPIKAETAARTATTAADSGEAVVEKTKDEALACEKVASSLSSSVKQRSVIEDIFDDWRDENPDDDCQPPTKAQDSVEMELKILLDGEKPAERENNGEKTNRSANRESPSADAPSGERSGLEDSKVPEASVRAAIGEVSQPETTEFREEEPEKRKDSLPAKETMAGLQRAGKTIEPPVVRDRIIRQKPLAPRPGVKVPGFLLTSPIVSKTAVSKVLKERLREQQKDYDSPGKPDIFFVKKITQRLSHKLAAASAAQVPGLVPLPQIGAKVDSSRVTKAFAASDEKIGGNVDKELLAILEGDVDPDWSNLKPPTLVSETKSSPTVTVEHNSPPKLDPLIERELALKQLLELPSSPMKKIVPKKGSAKTSKAAKGTTVPKTLSGRTGAKKDSVVDNSETTSQLLPEERIDIADSTESKVVVQESKLDETRSGRKRKPTEKAREHEQNSTKRVKVFRAKASGNVEPQTGDSPAVNKNEVISASGTESSEEESPPIDATSETARPPATTDDFRVGSSSRRVEAKKAMPKPSAKRKLPAGQKYIRQKMPANKKPTISLKAKFPKKASAKVMSHKRQKQRNGESSAGEAKPKKKVINEIDRLLQDEGVVNLLYDVEQPGKKRLVPITKSQTKVMDLQKIQRELKIRTKLVRNAVLRLRTSNINTSKVSPRSKRSVSHNNESRTDKKTGEQIKAGQTTVTSPTDFIFPAKIRNAADASIIIRRHSSSSFSSASASPRASIDTPERMHLEGGKVQDGFPAAHLLRSNKRRRSQEEDEKSEVAEASGLDDEEETEAEEEKKKTKKKKKQPLHSPESKRNRKRTVERPEAHHIDAETGTTMDEISVPKSKAAPTSGFAASFSTSAPPTPTTSAGRSKKVDAKKNSKSGKQQHQQVEVVDFDENSCSSGGNNVGKIATRSNGQTGGGKIIGKSKKSVKCKVSFAKEGEPVGKVDGHEQEDELSVCLAEAVTALSNDSGGPSRSRSTIPVNRNRTKGNLGGIKIGETDGNKSKLDTRVQFSNNEINVQRHGNLVQLLLTPSTTTKMRNGITLQVMQQLRETLSILKKDEECRVVLVTSTGSSFCEGLELSTLLHDNKEERRLRAEELANGVKEFIKSLATFNKPIVAGVQGSAVGLGVTMLPWFDLVIASDKATFSTPYGKLGQIAEGAAIFTLSHILGSAVTSELLLGGRTLTANEALRAGLVTRVLWPDRFQVELLPSLRAMSEQSSQSMEATKALLRHSLRKKLDAALESESYLLVQHWCSAECQAAITAYVDEKIQ